MLRMKWERLRSEVVHYFKVKKQRFNRFYWVSTILLVVFLFTFPLVLGARNPHVVVLDPFHENVMAARRNFDMVSLQARREQSRLGSFSIMMRELIENYPFFEIAVRSSGLDYMALAEAVFYDLTTIASVYPSPIFIRDFINEHYLSYFNGFGNVRVESQSAVIDWIHRPYYFGFMDWRFTDERFDLSVRNDNVSFATLADGVHYMRIYNFVAKGYEAVTFNPFWYFQEDLEGQLLLDYFMKLDNDAHLIIDIRGNADNFSGYFAPYVLTPFLQTPVNEQFYAFYKSGAMAQWVSREYRNWHGLGESKDADDLSSKFSYPLPAGITSGFSIPINLNNANNVTFNGQKWLVVDSGSFSGPNFMYLQLAREAGFIIVYQENNESKGWSTNFARLAGASIVLRFNPLYFTDSIGRPLEETGRVYDVRLPSNLQNSTAVWTFLEGM